MRVYGYAGRILYVNLSEGTFAVKPLPEELIRDYIGGRGFVARLVYDGIPPGADPLGPANRLVVASGPLAGTLVPGEQRRTWEPSPRLRGVTGTATWAATWRRK